MIRALTLLVLLALPASAQDFRGLLPGMPASILGPIGEPTEISRESGWTASYYPLPFGQRLTVVYGTDGRIVWLSSYALPNAPDAPDLGGLRVGQMRLSDVERYLGQDGAALDTFGLAVLSGIGVSFRIVYDHSRHEDILVVLEFLHTPSLGRDGRLRDYALPLPRNALLISADLIDRGHFENTTEPGAFIGGPRTAPIPFPLSIDEAFPSLIL